MELSLHSGEPEFGPRVAVGAAAVAAKLLRIADSTPEGRPAVIAVDGRSGAGKTSFAERMADLIPYAEVVHADDVAWHEPDFEWGHLLRKNVLEPLHRGQSVNYRPDAWERLGREGQIELPNDLRIILIEGVGAYNRDYAHLLDATVWVQCDAQLAEQRGMERDAGSDVDDGQERATVYWHESPAQERAFLMEQKPWEAADLVVCGTPDIPLGEDQFAVVKGARRCQPAAVSTARG